jgi:hypothetical protein
MTGICVLNIESYLLLLLYYFFPCNLKLIFKEIEIYNYHFNKFMEILGYYE